ncbi:MAG: hypothetical protein OHK0029_04930 [Armatimonadaceae bacterium]
MRQQLQSDSFSTENWATSQRSVREAARDAARRYLARFSPLLYALQSDDAGEVRSALETLRELEQGEREALANLEAHAEPQDAELVTTLRDAITQSHVVEEQLRRRLAFLEPGDQDGIVDLQEFRNRLATVAARQEVAEATSEILTMPAERRLEILLSKGGWAAALGMGIFAFGWLSFTTFHAIFMIGGMFKAFGWGALLMLGFYSIFFAVGGGMAWSAVEAASEETLSIEGDELRIRKQLGGWVREKQYTLGPQSRAGIALVTTNNNRSNIAQQEIAMVDANGSEFRFGRNCPAHMKQEYVDRINNHVRRTLRPV